jgi:hypothetical protein
MKDIAARAGVSAEAVWAQGGKASLLLAVVDRVLVGDDEPVPVRERRRCSTRPTRAPPCTGYATSQWLACPELCRCCTGFQRAEGCDAEIAAAYAIYGSAGSPTCGGLPKPSPRVSGQASRWPTVAHGPSGPWRPVVALRVQRHTVRSGRPTVKSIRCTALEAR